MLRDFYERTAASYDEQADQNAEHVVGLQLIGAVLRSLNVRRVLDVGCGTGRAMRALGAALPEVEVHGIDPSPDLLAIAIERHGIRPERLQCGDGLQLPFADGAFDAAVAVAVLHHVEHPDRIVAEMLRVSKIGVFLSDVNIYGQGRLAARTIKVGARLLGQSDRVNRLRHGGRRYFISEGDGVVFPYSLLDTIPQLQEVCSTVVTAPTKGSRAMHSFPLGAASHLVVCAVKDL